MGASDYSDNLMPGTTPAMLDQWTVGTDDTADDLEVDRYCSWCGLWMDEAADANDANGTPAEQAEERICADCVLWLAMQGKANGQGA